MTRRSHLADYHNAGIKSYTVCLERGDRVFAARYLVIAANDKSAARKARRRAQEWSGLVTRWRIVSLVENPEEVVA